MTEEKTIDEFIDSLTEKEHASWLRHSRKLCDAQDEVLDLRERVRELTESLKAAEIQMQRAEKRYWKFMAELRTKGD